VTSAPSLKVSGDNRAFVGNFDAWHGGLARHSFSEGGLPTEEEIDLKLNF
jgi:hypothetical protein